MKSLFVVLVILVITSPSLCARVSLVDVSAISNVVTYGAKGDGQTDDSQAFLKAWQEVCGANQGAATLLIPKAQTFLLQPVSFQGPCKPATINIELQGTITAPKGVNAWRWSDIKDRKTWVQFLGISGLVINGGGKVDGQGAAWWSISRRASDRPTAIRFLNCQNLRLSSLTHINSPRNHISINTCNGVSISDINIVAPNDSPNTDGIDIATSSNVLIQNSNIATGDDCIAIITGSTFVNITGIFCGPGHGISVGSLGQGGTNAKVEEVHVRNCTFTGTTNGARIKTWVGGSGFARKITFEDIMLVGTKNPVIIDQRYSDIPENNGAVQISDVTYSDVRGTTITPNAVQLNCDSSIPCTNIVFDRINITSANGQKTFGTCTNERATCTSSCNPIVSCR
ncbi:probable polygalacturonase At3g15720 [Abrus precatorius]|uniref:Probable polygalacturonase At3g15720 n=1 Tax=Abrus precatorius TaxID=3816 RepID=A0A8B8K1K1_ABRPR|nr:probable polygalacturonase At3g15720 [Abrus precatorius]